MSEFKTCTKCGEEKPATSDQFDRQKTGKYGLLAQCKACYKAYREANKEKRAERMAKYRAANKERITKYMAEYYVANKESAAEREAKYSAANKERIAERKAKYRIKNKKRIAEYSAANREKIAERQRIRWKTDPNFKTSATLRDRMRQLIKRGYKSASTLELLGCSIEFVRQHLEQQFIEGMTWDNHGEWHIDHIRPCASFDLTDPVQQRQCFHYTNLQPLWAANNISKGARWEPGQREAAQ